MSTKFQQLLDQIYENLNCAGAGGSFGPTNVYGNPEEFAKQDTKASMSIAGSKIAKSKQKKLKSKKTPIIKRKLPEKIWN
jgi:hypothetical protein